MTTTKLAAMALTAALAGACIGEDAEPAGPEEARDRIETTVPALQAAADETAVALDNQRFADLGLLIDTAGRFGGVESDPVVTQMATGLADRMSADGESSGDFLALAEELFSDANYEGDGVYRIPAELVCGAEDLECLDQVDEAELRLRAVVAGDGLDITVLIGPERDAPILVELRTDAVAGTVDLAELADAAVFLASLTGDSIDLPDQLQGRVRGSFEILASGARLGLAITQDVVIAGEVEGQPVSVAIGARDPLYAVTVDFDVPSVAVDFDLGPVELQLPWSSVDPESTQNDTLVVDWKGASASVVLDAADQLTVSNMGLGDGTSTVTVGDELLLSVDLNQDSGRRFDLNLSAGELGPRVTIDPGFDLELFVDASIADPEAPAHLSGVTYRAQLAGDDPTIELIDTGLDTLVRVVSGSITVTASDSADQVVAAEGDCLAGGLEPELEQHPVLGTMSAMVCPVTVQN